MAVTQKVTRRTFAAFGSRSLRPDASAVEVLESRVTAVSSADNLVDVLGPGSPPHAVVATPT